jgi:hypothetical protein
MKKIIALALTVLPLFAYPQASGVTLEWCQQKTRENYPLVRQYDLIGKTESYSVWAAIAGYLPRVSVSAKATDQSDVTHLSIKIPGITIASPSMEQYQILGEASETLWDGGVNATQKKNRALFRRCRAAQDRRRSLCAPRPGQPALFRNTASRRAASPERTLAAGTGNEFQADQLVRRQRHLLAYRSRCDPGGTVKRWTDPRKPRRFGKIISRDALADDRG